MVARGARYRLYERLPTSFTRRALRAEDTVRWLRSGESRRLFGLVDFLRVKSLARDRHGRTTAEVSIRVRSIGDQCVVVRPATTDGQVLLDTFVDGYHLPCADLGRDPALIVDLGANIGLTAADLAYRYPGVRVIAVEPEPSLAALAVRNCSSWSDRIEVISAAAWVNDGTVRFSMDSGNEWGGTVVDGDDGVEVPAVSLNTLLADEPAVDFVKMDVEGAELQLLAVATEWAAKTLQISVECHAPYTQSEAISALESLGFLAAPHPTHPTGVIGRRVGDGGQGEAQDGHTRAGSG